MQPIWLALGDSITWGYPSGPADSWTRVVSERLDLPVDNQGVNGDTLGGMADRLDHLLSTSQRYKFAVWMGGANDVVSGASLAEMQRDAQRIAAQLEAAGIPHIAGIPIPLHYGGYDEELKPFRTWLRGKYPRVIDFPLAFPSKDLEALLPDGVHPSSRGYQAMAEVAWQALSKGT